VIPRGINDGAGNDDGGFWVANGVGLWNGVKINRGIGERGETVDHIFPTFLSKGGDGRRKGVTSRYHYPDALGGNPVYENKACWFDVERPEDR